MGKEHSVMISPAHDVPPSCCNYIMNNMVNNSLSLAMQIKYRLVKIFIHSKLSKKNPRLKQPGIHK